VILFEMLSGKVPFGGEGYGEIIVKHITQPAPSVREVAPELSPAIDLILHRAMAKKPDERFQSMSDLQAAMMDPDGYAANALRSGIVQSIPGDRSTGAMSRAQQASAASQFGTSGGQSATRGPSGSPSTFRQTVGELVEDDIVPASSGRGKMVGIAAVLVAAAVAGVFVLKRGKGGPVAAQAPITAVTPAVAATPATVRINFNSDPGRAMVVRADTGKELGVTPLSTEMPYSDTAVEFIFKKDGYDNKAVFVVPNLPSPIFTSLQPVAKPAVKSEPVATRPEPTSAQPAKKPTPHKKATRVQRLDDDAVLEPTFK